MADSRSTPPRDTPTDADDLLSIGDLAELTGIAPDTIRVWERRYGKPQAVRLPSGHRRYTDEHVRWLRRVAEALARGHRPARTVALSEAELDALLTEGEGAEPTPAPVQRLIALAAASDMPRLRRALQAELKGLGPVPFLRERIAPLLSAVGRAWADGEISVRHEHLVSEVVEDTIRGIRRDLPTPRRGPLMVLGTLPDEQHGLGVQMVAVVCAKAGVRTQVLGVNAPLEEIALAAEEGGADAVGLSVSLATGGIKTDRLLATLRGHLPPGVRLLVGGAGARGVRRGPQGVEYAGSWDELEAWLKALAAQATPGKGAGGA